MTGLSLSFLGLWSPSTCLDLCRLLGISCVRGCLLCELSSGLILTSVCVCVCVCDLHADAYVSQSFPSSRRLSSLDTEDFGDFVET